MLLPLPSAIVRSRSLKFHAALAMVRRNLADAEHLVELARVTYLAWFLQRAGYGALSLAQFHEAEQYMEQANRRGAEIDRWYLDEAAYPGFERILAQHEQQLASAPAYAVVAAEDELSRFIAGDTHSPLPPITPEQSSATPDV